MDAVGFRNGNSVDKSFKCVRCGVIVGVCDSVGWVVDKCVGAGVDSADIITFGIIYESDLVYSNGLFDGFNGEKNVGSLLYESL